MRVDQMITYTKMLRPFTKFSQLFLQGNAVIKINTENTREL